MSFYCLSSFFLLSNFLFLNFGSYSTSRYYYYYCYYYYYYYYYYLLLLLVLLLLLLLLLVLLLSLLLSLLLLFLLFLLSKWSYEIFGVYIKFIWNLLFCNWLLLDEFCRTMSNYRGLETKGECFRRRGGWEKRWRLEVRRKCGE